MNQKFFILGLTLTLMVGVSCTAGELPLATQPDGDPNPVVGIPADSVPPVPADSSAGAPVDTGAVASPTDTGTTVPLDTMPPFPEDTTLAAQDPSVPGTSVLVCDPQPYASATVEIGRSGGLIVVGNHNLRIPQGALSHRVVITMEQVEGTANSVRFSPEGLFFERPAVLTLSYKNCPNVKHWKRIVYTDEELNVLEPTFSYDFSSSSQVKGLIFHFSRYAVAY